MLRLLGLVLAAALVVIVVYAGGIVLGLYGTHEEPGEITEVRIPEETVASRSAAQRAAARAQHVPEPKQILFGDLHVHTTFSTDAFQGSLPMMQGEGAHPPADACDFARFCSALDFWSLNDHAEGLTPRRWREMKETLRQCNAVAGDPKNPDVVAFLGWEWTQVGATPETHWGHQNVIFRDLGDDQVPRRPIAATGYVRQALSNIPLRVRLAPPLLDFSLRQRYFDFDRFAREVADVPECTEGVHVRELPEECAESAATPGDLNRLPGLRGTSSSAQSSMTPRSGASSKSSPATETRRSTATGAQ
jgi:hypothetical protein